MSFAPGSRRVSVALCFSFLCFGCAHSTSRFIQSDPAFHAQAASTPPKLFIEEAPTTPFAPVGVVQIQGTMATPKDEFIHSAVAEGTGRGCDVLVHEALYEVWGGPRLSRRTGIASWLFTCGVFDPAKSPEESAKLADARLDEIIRNEFGTPTMTCPVEYSTGTHLPRTVCRRAGAFRLWNNGVPWIRNTR